MARVLEFATMERVTESQAALLAFLLMTSAVVIDAVLERIVPDPVRTAVLALSILLGIPVILECSPGGWPQRTRTGKAVFAGLASRLLR
jgi:hypothetical protein